MEDRYLSKAKRIDDGDWLVGYVVKYGYTGKEKYYIVPSYASDLYAIEVDPSTICRCTGLEDKNGKLIWENDIVRDTHGNFYAVFYLNNYYRFSWICVKSDTFLVGAMWNLWSFHSFEVEVVGNIFDNPDLLGINTQNDLDRHWLEKYTEENDKEKRD